MLPEDDTSDEATEVVRRHLLVPGELIGSSQVVNAETVVVTSDHTWVVVRMLDGARLRVYRCWLDMLTGQSPVTDGIAVTADRSFHLNDAEQLKTLWRLEGSHLSPLDVSSILAAFQYGPREGRVLVQPSELLQMSAKAEQFLAQVSEPQLERGKGTIAGRFYVWRIDWNQEARYETLNVDACDITASDGDLSWAWTPVIRGLAV